MRRGCFVCGAQIEQPKYKDKAPPTAEDKIQAIFILTGQKSRKGITPSVIKAKPFPKAAKACFFSLSE